MKWRKWHRAPKCDDEAKRSAEHAQSLLDAVIRNRPRVSSDAAWSRGARERNHLTELFRGGNS